METAYKPLEIIHKKSLASTPPHLQRMLLHLQHYDISVKYHPGKEMVLADSLSHLSPIPDKEIHFEQSVYAVQFSNDRLRQLKHDWDKLWSRGHSTEGHHHWWLARQRKATTQKPVGVLVLQGWIFSGRWTCTERRTRADSNCHEELHPAKHPRRSSASCVPKCACTGKASTRTLSTLWRHVQCARPTRTVSSQRHSSHMTFQMVCGKC